MAKEKDEEVEELTEEQRIAQLEKRVSTNKVMLAAVGLVLIIGISVSVTSFVLSMFTEEVESVDVEAFTTLTTEVAELKTSLEARDKEIAELKALIPALQGSVKNSSNAILKQVALEQEQNNQTFLKALKSGMKDLAYMVPGSRTWYELYDEQISGAIANSEAREEKLKQLNKGVMVYEDDGFEF